MVYKSLLLPLLATGLLCCSLTSTAQNNSKNSAVARKNQQSGYFVENKGQIHDQNNIARPDIDYKLATGSGLTIFLGSSSIHYQWAKPVEKSGHSSQVRTASYGVGEASEPTMALSPAFQMYRMDVELVGANSNPEVVTEQQQSFYERYYPKDITARSFKKITYKNVYPNIDWVFYFNTSGQLEHDFLVRPGASPTDIKIRYSGAAKLSVNKDGSLTAVTDLGTITEKAPHSYDQEGRIVSSHFKLDKNILSFATGSYSGSLTIDPTLEWGTYYGGADRDYADCITSDVVGNVYLSGYTLSSTNIATTGAFQSTYGGSDVTSNAGDVFVSKFDCSGNCNWTTYYGGEAGERGWNVRSDDYGNIYLAGFTNNLSGLSPVDTLGTSGSYEQNPIGGNDVFLIKFDSSGSRIWGTYYGGTGNECSATLPVGLTLDKQGHVYLSGTTNSTNNIATTGSYQPTLSGSNDAFIVQFDTAGNRQWATYYGGSGNDRAGTIYCDKSDNIYLTGITASSSGIATVGSHQSSFGGGNDAYLAKFDVAGTLQWASYYGGSGNADEGMGICTDSLNNIYLAGRTNSTTAIATTGSFQNSYGGGTYDAFLTKFDSSGTRLWGTYFGGVNLGTTIGYNSVTLDNSENIYLVGYARESDSSSTPGSFQEINGGAEDGTISKFSSDGELNWSSYFGGGGTDYITAIRIDIFGNVYATGGTTSTANITTSGSYQDLYGGGAFDAFLIKLNEATSYPEPDSIYGNVIVCAGSNNIYHVVPVIGAGSYSWTLPSSWTGSSTSDSITLTVGTATDTIKIAAQFACGTSVEKILIVSVVPSPIINSTSASLCAHDSAVLSVTMPAGTGIQWQKNNIDIIGATDTAYTATETGDYRVIISAGSCVDTSASVTVHANPIPVITQTGSVLSTTESFPGYQWNFNDTPITGATGTTYNATVEGSYSVTVTDANGCTGTSEAVEIGSTGIFDPKAADQVSVYPNPAMETIHIQSTIPVSASLTTVDGKVLIKSANTSQLNIKELADALYFLRISDHNGNLIKIVKVIKQTSRK